MRHTLSTLILLAASLLPTSAAYASDILSIVPQDSTLYDGQTLTLYIQAQSDAMYGFQFDLSFPSFLTFVEEDPQGMFASDFFVPGTVNPDNTITGTYGSVEGSDVFSGTGNVASFVFLVTGIGSDTVSLQNALFATDLSFDTSSPDLTNGTANITALAAPEPATWALFAGALAAGLAFRRRGVATAVRGIVLLAGCGLCLRADVRLTMTTTGPRNGVTQEYVKGREMRVDRGQTSTILDLRNGTATVLNHQQKTYSVVKLGGARQIPMSQSGMAPKANVRHTGAHRAIDGHDCEQVLLDVELNAGGKQIKVDSEIWLAPEPPSAELQNFTRGLRELVPAYAGSGGVMAEIEKRTAELKGMVLAQTTRVHVPGAPVVESSTRTTGLSTAAVPVGMFAVPRDYRRIGK